MTQSQMDNQVISLYDVIPTGVDEDGLRFHRQNCLYTYLSKPLIDDLVLFLGQRRVLEVYAGRGHLSALLQSKGIDVRATSLQQGHDGSYGLGHACEVEIIDVIHAVAKYSEWLDVLLVCWPTTDEGLFRSLAFLPEHVEIVFIGEVTDYASKPPFLGGCATDAFFESVIEIPDLSRQIRYTSDCQDRVKVYRKRK